MVKTVICARTGKTQFSQRRGDAKKNQENIIVILSEADTTVRDKKQK